MRDSNFNTFVYFLLTIMVLTQTPSSHADLVVFSDRTSYEAATSTLGIEFEETYDSFGVDTVISSDPGMPSEFNGFDAYFTGTGGPTGFSDFSAQTIDVPAFNTGGGLAIDGTPYFAAFAADASNTIVSGQEGQVFFLMNAGTRAFGFDYMEWGELSNNTEAQITTSSGVFTVANPASVNGFFGFHVTGANETVESITFLPTAGALGYDGIGIDNVSTISSIPEPGSLALLGLGLSLSLVKRKRVS